MKKEILVVIREIEKFLIFLCPKPFDFLNRLQRNA